MSGDGHQLGQTRVDWGTSRTTPLLGFAAYGFPARAGSSLHWMCNPSRANASRSRIPAAHRPVFWLALKALALELLRCCGGGGLQRSTKAWPFRFFHFDGASTEYVSSLRMEPPSCKPYRQAVHFSSLQGRKPKSAWPERHREKRPLRMHSIQLKLRRKS